MQTPLLASANATFSSDGVARVSLSPRVFGVSWEVKRVVIATTSTKQSRFYLYLNVESPGTQLDSSYNGEQDTSETEIKMQALDTLIGKWTGGDVGAICTMTITGIQDNGR